MYALMNPSYMKNELNNVINIHNLKLKAVFSLRAEF